VIEAESTGSVTESAAIPSRRDAVEIAQRFIAGYGMASMIGSPGGTAEQRRNGQPSLRDWIARWHVSPAMNRWAIFERPSGAVGARASANWINRRNCHGPESTRLTLQQFTFICGGVFADEPGRG